VKYSKLIELMHKFRNGDIARAEMILAFTLWQLPENKEIGER